MQVSEIKVSGFFFIHSVHLKTHTFKMLFFILNWVAIFIYFAQCTFIHIILLINAQIDWFRVIRFALHLSRQKTHLVRGHNMHKEIEQCYAIYWKSHYKQSVKTQWNHSAFVCHYSTAGYCKQKSGCCIYSKPEVQRMPLHIGFYATIWLLCDCLDATNVLEEY